MIEVSGIGRPLGVVLREQLAARACRAHRAMAQIETGLTELEHGRQIANIPGWKRCSGRASSPTSISQLTIDPARPWRRSRRRS